MRTASHNSRRRGRAPWLRSVEESVPRQRADRGPVRPLEAVAAIVVVLAVLAFFVWFLLLATGGPGPGTV